LFRNSKLYIKITEEGKKYVGKYYKEGYAYKGTKISMLIDITQIEDHEWLSELIAITSRKLSIPKHKK
jgi:TfoX/Sxy family transcriptional regulator of competence genes